MSQNLFQLAQSGSQSSLGRRSGIATFVNAPLSEDLKDVDVGIVGVPFDGGMTSTPGTAEGPREVRNQCVRRSINTYNTALKINPFERHRIYDCGDVVVSRFSVAEASDAITNAVSVLLNKNILPVCVGGNHFVTYPILKAIFKKHGPVGVLHFDAHTDLLDHYFEEKYMNATMYRRGFEEGFILPGKFIQAGIRRLYGEDEINYAFEQNIRLISTAELKQMGTEGFKRELEVLKGIKLYVTFDIDFVDPAFAPGTGGPEPGGVTSFETLELIRCLQGLDIVGLDLVEVCPALDNNGITSLLAAHILFEMLSVLPGND